MRHLPPIYWRKVHGVLTKSGKPTFCYAPDRLLSLAELDVLDAWCNAVEGSEMGQTWGRELMSERVGVPININYWFTDPNHAMQFILVWQGVSPSAAAT